MAKDRPRIQQTYHRISRRKTDKSVKPDVPLLESAADRNQESQTENWNSPLSSTAGLPMDASHRQDSLIVEEVGDSWLRSRWTISSKTLERAHSAMGRDGHKSRRVLRLLKVEQDESGPRSKELFQEFDLPASAEEWFAHVPSTEHAWLVEVGVSFGNGRFFSMLHSVPVTLNGSRATLQGARRYLGSEANWNHMEGGEPPDLKVQGTFQLHGSTVPGSRVNIDDQIVPVDSRTGAFEWKLPLSNGRVVVPMSVVNSGKTQRALLAIDLNFHLLEPEPTSDH